MTEPELPAVVQRVSNRMRELGCPGQPRALDEVRSQVDAAPRERLVSSHLYRAKSDKHFLVLLPSGRMADPIQLSGVLGEAELVELPSELAEIRTGHHFGGLAPVATDQRSDVVLDIALARSTVLWIPAGDPEWMFPSSYAQLLRITAGIAAEVGDLVIENHSDALDS